VDRRAPAHAGECVSRITDPGGGAAFAAPPFFLELHEIADVAGNGVGLGRSAAARGVLELHPSDSSPGLDTRIGGQP
jgi:hypothetical protein